MEIQPTFIIESIIAVSGATQSSSNAQTSIPTYNQLKYFKNIYNRFQMIFEFIYFNQ